MRSTLSVRTRVAVATVFALAVTTVVSLGATPASSADRTVTLTGSLQSELGCAGDWSPTVRQRTWHRPGARRTR